MKQMEMEISRGDIFFVAGYKRNIGLDQNRPAVVVSNNNCNTYSNVIEVVYLTAADKNSYLPTHVEVMCQVPSTALCERIYSIPKDKLGEYVRTCSNEEMKRVDEALMISLGIEQPHHSSSDNEREVIDDLKMKLEGAERMLDENILNRKLNEEKAKTQQLEMVLRAKEKELNLARSNYDNNTVDNSQIIKLETERDLYKKLYEEMLGKVLAKEE